jgi:hypothetical protein
MLWNSLHPLHAPETITCSVYLPRPPQRLPAGAIKALAVRSPFSVGFILQDNIPEPGDHCEVLAAYR